MGCKPLKNLAIKLVGGYFHNEWFFSFKSGNETTTIPFEVINGWIIIKVKIGNDEHRFLFDTGATTSLEPEFINKLSLTTIKNFRTTDANGVENSVPLVSIPKLTLGNRSFINIGAFASHHESTKCNDIKGVIGHNLLYGSVWKINFEKKTITISQGEPDLEIKNFDVIKIKTDWKKMMSVKLSAKKVKINALIDTGLPNSIILNKKYINNFSKSNFIKMKRSIISTAHSSKVDTITIYKSGSIRLKGISLDRGNLIFSNLESSIGNGFFSNFQEVVINMKEKRLLISKIRLPLEAQNTTNINISWRNGMTQIIGLTIDSKIEKQGLKIGDCILSINNRSTSFFQNACEYKIFENTMKIYDNDLYLTVLREGQKFDYKISKALLHE